jgi:hypothetical protein
MAKPSKKPRRPTRATRLKTLPLKQGPLVIPDGMGEWVEFVCCESCGSTAVLVGLPHTKQAGRYLLEFVSHGNRLTVLVGRNFAKRLGKALLEDATMQETVLN